MIKLVVINKCVFFLILLTTTGCSSLFFRSDKRFFVTPQNFNLNYEEIALKINQKEHLVGWHLFSKQKPSKGLVVQFHGNAENQSSHFLQLSWIVDYGYDLITFDYRGFGKSSGSSSLESLKADCKIVYDHLAKIKKADQQLIIVGQSLGGYLLLQTLANSSIENQIDLLILDSTFYSMKEMLKSKSTILSWFSPKENLPKPIIVKKILIAHGTRDPVIPFINGEKLHQLFPESIWWKIDEGRHLDLFTAHDFRYRSEFLKILAHPDTFQTENYTLNQMDKIFLKSKKRNDVNLTEQLETHKKDFLDHPSSKKIPQTCSPRCLCPLYAELFKRLGSQKLSQHMYRQNLSNQDLIDKNCLSEEDTRQTAPN